MSFQSAFWGFFEVWTANYGHLGVMTSPISVPVFQMLNGRYLLKKMHLTLNWKIFQHRSWILSFPKKRWHHSNRIFQIGPRPPLLPYKWSLLPYYQTNICNFADDIIPHTSDYKQHLLRNIKMTDSIFRDLDFCIWYIWSCFDNFLLFLPKYVADANLEHK